MIDLLLLLLMVMESTETGSGRVFWHEMRPNRKVLTKLLAFLFCKIRGIGIDARSTSVSGVGGGVKGCEQLV